MKEFFQGRRFGFSPRAAIAYIAAGIGFSLTLTDLMAWFAWGQRDTTGYVVVSDWLAHTVTVVLAIAILAVLAEYIDVPADDRSIARLDLVAGLVGPAPFLLAIAGLIVTFVDAAVAANLYSAREWEELDDEPIRERRPRRRAASR